MTNPMTPEDVIAGLKRLRGITMIRSSICHRDALDAAIALIEGMQWRPIDNDALSGREFEIVVIDPDRTDYRIIKSRYYDAGICPDTGQDYGVGMMWHGVREYIETVTHYRPLSALPLPKDKS